MTSTTQETIILKRCGPCPDFASLTLAFALEDPYKILIKTMSCSFFTSFMH